MSVLGPVLAQTPVSSIDDVVVRMTAIDQALPSTDGISCFNKLYLEVTKNVSRGWVNGPSLIRHS